MNDDGNDGRHLPRARILAEPRFPDANDIAQHPERHERVDGALVLDEHVEKHVSSVERRREEKVAMNFAELLVHEARGLESERARVDGLDELWSQGGPQEGE